MSKSPSIPTPGAMALVRNRHGMVTGVREFQPKDGPVFHLVDIEYADSEGAPGEQLVWELETHKESFAPSQVPSPDPSGTPMLAREFDALVRSVGILAVLAGEDLTRAAGGFGELDVAEFAVLVDVRRRAARGLGTGTVCHRAAAVGRCRLLGCRVAAGTATARATALRPRALLGGNRLALPAGPVVVAGHRRDARSLRVAGGNAGQGLLFVDLAASLSDTGIATADSGSVLDKLWLLLSRHGQHPRRRWRLLPA